MTHVVTSACVGHKYKDCVAVWPVEAFKEADTYLVIDPDECIDCAACVAECPVEAIFADTDVPDEEMEWIDRNETESLDLEIATGDSPVLADWSFNLLMNLNIDWWMEAERLAHDSTS